jgi:D-sedoheptulose 7-phosphate isomerase
MTTSLNLASVFTDAITEHLAIIGRIDAQQEAFERVAIRMTECLLQGHKILWCGNGGSAAAAQHLAAELIGRFRSNRRALASIALSSDTSVLTAIANDCGFGEVFERQLEALCAPGDVVVGLSTSGKSRNVCAALERAPNWAPLPWP